AYSRTPIRSARRSRAPGREARLVREAFPDLRPYRSLRRIVASDQESWVLLRTAPRSQHLRTGTRGQSRARAWAERSQGTRATHTCSTSSIGLRCLLEVWARSSPSLQ